MTKDDEEINLKKWQIAVVFLIIGICIGGLIVGYYNKKQVYRNPEEIAIYLEEMLFELKHFEDIQHSQLKALISMDTTTIGDMKRWYRAYEQNGISRMLLETQVNIICYRTKWNTTKQ